MLYIFTSTVRNNLRQKKLKTVLHGEIYDSDITVRNCNILISETERYKTKIIKNISEFSNIINQLDTLISINYFI